MIFLECQIPFANGGKGRPQGRYGGKEGGKGAGAGRGEKNDKGPSEGDNKPETEGKPRQSAGNTGEGEAFSLPFRIISLWESRTGCPF